MKAAFEKERKKIKGFLTNISSIISHFLVKKLEQFYCHLSQWDPSPSPCPGSHFVLGLDPVPWELFPHGLCHHICPREPPGTPRALAAEGLQKAPIESPAMGPAKVPAMGVLQRVLQKDPEIVVPQCGSCKGESQEQVLNVLFPVAPGLSGSLGSCAGGVR